MNYFARLFKQVDLPGRIAYFLGGLFFIAVGIRHGDEHLAILPATLLVATFLLYAALKLKSTSSK